MGNLCSKRNHDLSSVVAAEGTRSRSPTAMRTSAGSNGDVRKRVGRQEQEGAQQKKGDVGLAEYHVLVDDLLSNTGDLLEKASTSGAQKQAISIVDLMDSESSKTRLETVLQEDGFYFSHLIPEDKMMELRTAYGAKKPWSADKARRANLAKFFKVGEGIILQGGKHGGPPARSACWILQRDQKYAMHLIHHGDVMSDPSLRFARYWLSEAIGAWGSTKIARGGFRG